MKRGGYLRPRSEKRRKTMAERRKMLSKLRSDLCAASKLVPYVKCSGSLDPHEPLTRARGGSITDPSNLIWLCRSHHDFVHDYPHYAHELGLLKHSWERPEFIRRDAWCEECLVGYPDILLSLDGDLASGTCPEGHVVEMTLEAGDL